MDFLANLKAPKYRVVVIAESLKEIQEIRYDIISTKSCNVTGHCFASLDDVVLNSICGADLFIVKARNCARLELLRKVSIAKLILIVDKKDSVIELDHFWRIPVFEIIVSPYKSIELKTKVERVLAIAVSDPKDKDIDYMGIIKFNEAKKHVIIKGCLIELTCAESTLFAILLKSQKRYTTCADFNSLVKMKCESENISENNFRTTVCRLNQKISSVSGIKIILSRYGFGYYLSI